MRHPATPVVETQPSGLLSNVFSYVTREIESFVTTATGGSEVKVQRRPQASSSRVKLDEALDQENKLRERRERRRKARPSGGEREVQKLRRRRSPSHSGSEHAHDAADTQRPIPKLRLSPRRSSSPPQSNKNESRENGAPRSRSPSPVATQSTSRMLAPATSRPTMPGSLFPRSPSMMPESPPLPGPARVDPHQRPSSPAPADAEETSSSGPSQTNGKTRPRPNKSANGSAVADADSAKMPPPDLPSRLRNGHSGADQTRRNKSRRVLDEDPEATPRPGTSVREAVERFSDDADPSLMLPSPQRTWKGKERDDGNVRPEIVHTNGSAVSTSNGDDARISPDEMRVRGKERELRAVREASVLNAHSLDEEERERDKERIRMLEKEIAWLKAQLAARTEPSSAPPPPPPPPPPPNVQRMPNSSLPPSIPPGLAAQRAASFLAEARACLKPTTPPVEAPINNAMAAPRTRRAGQPTVNVPSEKMAAFLNEMKSVRLRKIGAGANGSSNVSLSRSTSNAVGGPSRRYGEAGNRSFEVGSRSFEVGDTTFEVGNRSLFELPRDLRLGDKRKRVESISTDSNDLATATKRRLTVPDPSNTSLSEASTSFASSSGPRRVPYDPYATQTSWPSISTTDTEVTTPSLTSDNDVDGEHEQDHDTGQLHTPPGHEDHVVELQEERPIEEPREIIEIEDDDMEPETPQNTSRFVARGTPHPRKDVFAMRPPKSPMPAGSLRPSRPLPLSRSRSARRSSSARDEGSSNSDDPLSIQPSSRHSHKSRIPTLVQNGSKEGVTKKSKKPSRDGTTSSRGGSARNSAASSNATRRRQTLDDELRRAGDNLWSDELDGLGDEEGGEAAVDVDSGHLIGVGTKSKRKGFLSGGGAGGVPVFMGVGYVEGAVDED